MRNPALLLLLACAACSAAPADELRAPKLQLRPPPPAHETSDDPPPDEPDQKPSRLNRLHDALFMGVQHVLHRVDNLFRDDDDPPRPLPYSQFRLGLYTEFEERGGSDISVDPEFDIELRLPSLTRKFRVFATTDEIDRLPSDPGREKPGGFRIGLREIVHAHVELDAGAKLRVSPYFFTSLRLKDEWTGNDRTWSPGLKGFWRSDRGFGGNAYLVMHQYREPWGFRTAGSLLWAEYSNGVEWEYSIAIAHARKLLRPGKYTNLRRARDLAHGSGLHFSVAGHLDDDKITDAYQLRWFNKRPIVDGWCHLVVTPFVTWRNIDDWEPEPGIMVGFDMLFWDVSSPRE